MQYYRQARAGLLVVLVPVQPLLIKLDDNLGNLDIGFFGRNKVCLV